MFLRMDEARRYWGLNGLGGLPEASDQEKRDLTADARDVYAKSRESMTHSRALDVQVLANAVLQRSIRFAPFAAAAGLGVDAVTFFGGDRPWESTATIQDLATRAMQASGQVVRTARTVAPAPSTQVRNEPSLQKRAQLFVDALAATRDVPHVLSVWAGAQEFFKTVPATDPGKAEAVRQVTAAKDAALTRIRANLTPAPAPAPQAARGPDAAQYEAAFARAQSLPAVETLWSTAQARFAGPDLVRVASAMDRARQRLSRVPDLAPVPYDPPIKPGVPQKPKTIGKPKPPAGGALDTQTRDQVLLDLASGRGTDLTIGPGGGFRPAGSGKGVSTGTAVALAVSGVAALALFAVVLRRSG